MECDNHVEHTARIRYFNSVSFVENKLKTTIG